MTQGLINTEWANPVNYERMRNERLARVRSAMTEHQMEALVCFGSENIKHMTGILGIPVPKLFRYGILTLDKGPILYELGGDIGRVKENAPWCDIRIAVPIQFVSKQELLSWAVGLKRTFRELGVKGAEIGFDQIPFKLWGALKEAGIEAQDGGSIMAIARSVKTADEVELIRASVALAEVAFEEARRVLRPGVRECDIQTAMAKVLFERGAEMVRGVCTARSYPYWRTVTSERQVRAGDILIIDRVHLYKGYACDHVRSFVCGKASARQKDIYKRCKVHLQAALDQVKPGNTTADVQAKLGDPEDYSEHSLQFGHGIGLDIHEPPTMDCFSTKDPALIKPNMTLAVETYAHDETQGVRLEQNILVTGNGYELLSTYPLGEDFE